MTQFTPITLEQLMEPMTSQAQQAFIVDVWVIHTPHPENKFATITNHLTNEKISEGVITSETLTNLQRWAVNRALIMPNVIIFSVMGPSLGLK